MGHGNSGRLFGNSSSYPDQHVFCRCGRASDYPLGKFLVVVAISRAVSAILRSHWSPIFTAANFVCAIRHPMQYWGWMLLFASYADGGFGRGGNSPQPPPGSRSRKVNDYRQAKSRPKKEGREKIMSEHDRGRAAL